MSQLNFTHDPARRSFVDSANQPDCDFPIQNLPFGVFSCSGEKPRGGVAIGDRIVDLRALSDSALLSEGAAVAAKAASSADLNELMALGNEPASALRADLSRLLVAESPVQPIVERLLVPMTEVQMHLPARIGNFSDFLASKYHSDRLIAPGQDRSNFVYIPLGYHSRASSIRLEGPVVRPHGQRRTEDEVIFGPTTQMDFELEVGFFVGRGSALGDPILISDAKQHLFGYCLLNDWSARDLQRWENTPSGPFSGKNMSTTLSPWIVTTEALAPFRCSALTRENGDPAPLPYLNDSTDQAEGGIDLCLTASITTARMREAGEAPHEITKTNFRYMYWTPAQMLAHHAVAGCNMQPGDILGAGTTSGPTDESRACMAELTERGSNPLRLPNGEMRGWLQDGDEIIFHGMARREGYVSIGMGICRGSIVPAVKYRA